MNGRKSWYQSKGVWGAVVAIIAGGAGVFGFTFGAEAQAETVNLFLQIGATAGGVLALIGRLAAKSKIGAEPKSLLRMWLLLPVFALAGCATNTAALPTSAEQKADEIGPQVIHNYKGVFILRGLDLPEGAGVNANGLSFNQLAHTLIVRIEGDDTVDASQAGSAEQSADVGGATSGDQKAEAEGNLEIPIVP